jgi:hypothetical protein
MELEIIFTRLDSIFDGIFDNHVLTASKSNFSVPANTLCETLLFSAARFSMISSISLVVLGDWMKLCLTGRIFPLFLLAWRGVLLVLLGGENNSVGVVVAVYTSVHGMRALLFGELNFAARFATDPYESLLSPCVFAFDFVGLETLFSSISKNTTLEPSSFAVAETGRILVTTLKFVSPPTP